jgi:hypothetical protein
MRSVIFHLLAPYAVQLTVFYLLIRSLPDGGMIGILLFGGWIALLCLGLISIPFGVAHFIQAIYFAPNWPSRSKQFLVGLLNPSFSILTLIAIFYLAPASFI